MTPTLIFKTYIWDSPLLFNWVSEKLNYGTLKRMVNTMRFFHSENQYSVITIPTN